MALHPLINAACRNRQAFKIILGLNNFNLKDIVAKVKAAEVGGATYIDVAANPTLVREICQISSIPICVSSIHVDDLIECCQAGAHMVEIGNFDIFYERAIKFSSGQVVDLVLEVMKKIPKVPICATVPHHLDLKCQIQLAIRLESIGVTMIQTEGISSKCHKENYLLNSLKNASSALSSTLAIANSVNVPVITASGINSLTAPIAIAYGASGIGIASFLNTFSDPLELSDQIYSIASSVNGSKYIRDLGQDFKLQNISAYAPRCIY